MTLGITLAIMAIMLFAFILIVLLFYTGPILVEIRRTMSHVANITETADERTRKIDKALDGLAAALSVFSNIKDITGPLAKFAKKSKRSSDDADES